MTPEDKSVITELIELTTQQGTLLNLQGQKIRVLEALCREKDMAIEYLMTGAPKDEMDDESIASIVDSFYAERGIDGESTRPENDAEDGEEA